MGTCWAEEVCKVGTVFFCQSIVKLSYISGKVDGHLGVERVSENKNEPSETVGVTPTQVSYPVATMALKPDLQPLVIAGLYNSPHTLDVFCKHRNPSHSGAHCLV